MKQKVEKILQDTGYAENRGAKMTVNDLLMWASSCHIYLRANACLHPDYSPHFMTVAYILLEFMWLPGVNHRSRPLAR